MPTESNTSSDVGQTAVSRGTKSRGLIKSHKHGEKRLIGPSETPREKMVRVVMSVQKKRKKR